MCRLKKIMCNTKQRVSQPTLAVQLAVNLVDHNFSQLCILVCFRLKHPLILSYLCVNKLSKN